MPRWPQVLAGVGDGLARAARRDRAGRAQIVAAAARARRSSRRPTGDARPGVARRRGRRAAARLRRGARRLLGARAEVPAPPRAIEFLLGRGGEREMALHTLRAMANGGMYDQVGGGFARYSRRRALGRPALREDALRQRAARPRVPARLAGVGRRAASRACARRRSTGRCASCARPRAASPPRSTPTPRAWRAASTSGRRTQVREALGDDALAEAALAHFGIDRGGQLRGRATSPCARRRDPPELRRDQARACCAARERRVRPGARRQAAHVVERADDLRARRRRRGARSARTTSTRPRALRGVRPARPARRRRPPAAHLQPRARPSSRAYLEDHAFLLEALLTLYEATFDPRWFGEARELAETILERFADPEHGGFFSTADDHEPLVARRKELEDTPIPSGRLGGRLRAAAARPR